MNHSYAALACLLIAGLICPGYAQAKKKKDTVALFPFVERDNPKQATVDKVYDLMEEASAFVNTIVVLSGKKLAKKLKKPPKKAIMACGSDLKCMARLGKKARAKEVILARATPAEGRGVEFTFLAIGVRSKSVERQTKFTVKGPKGAKSVVGEKIYEVFGVSPPDPVTEPMAVAEPPIPDGPPGEAVEEEDPLGDIALAAIPEAEKKPKTKPKKPEPEPEPATATSSDEGDPPGDDLLMPLEELPEITPDEQIATAQPEESGGSSHLWRWIGVGVAAMGVGVLAGGAAVGSKAKSLESVPDDLTQLQVLDRQREQNDKAGTATALLAAGGAITGVGILAIVLDAVLADDEPSLSVDVGPDGGKASVLFRW